MLLMTFEIWTPFRRNLCVEATSKAPIMHHEMFYKPQQSLRSPQGQKLIQVILTRFLLKIVTKVVFQARVTLFLYGVLRDMGTHLIYWIFLKLPKTLANFKLNWRQKMHQIFKQKNSENKSKFSTKWKSKFNRKMQPTTRKKFFQSLATLFFHILFHNAINFHLVEWFDLNISILLIFHYFIPKKLYFMKWNIIKFLSHFFLFLLGKIVKNE